MRRLMPLLPCLLVLAALAGCGNERQRAPGTPPAADPIGPLRVELPRHGLRFEHPANWPVAAPRPPQVAAINSGEASLSIWRYPRQERLPSTEGDLLRARRALVAAVRARDRTLRILSARTLRVRGVPAVQLVANEKIGVARRQVRSTHLYAHRAEVVVDAYAPPAQFARVDRGVFAPLLRSLQLLPPRARPRR